MADNKTNETPIKAKPISDEANTANTASQIVDTSDQVGCTVSSRTSPVGGQPQNSNIYYDYSNE